MSSIIRGAEISQHNSGHNLLHQVQREKHTFSSQDWVSVVYKTLALGRKNLITPHEKRSIQWYLGQNEPSQFSLKELKVITSFLTGDRKIRQLFLNAQIRVASNFLGLNRLIMSKANSFTASSWLVVIDQLQKLGRSDSDIKRLFESYGDCEYIQFHSDVEQFERLIQLLQDKGISTERFLSEPELPKGVHSLPTQQRFLLLNFDTTRLDQFDRFLQNWTENARQFDEEQWCVLFEKLFLFHKENGFTSLQQKEIDVLARKIQIGTFTKPSFVAKLAGCCATVVSEFSTRQKLSHMLSSKLGHIEEKELVELLSFLSHAENAAPFATTLAEYVLLNPTPDLLGSLMLCCGKHCKLGYLDRLLELLQENRAMSSKAVEDTILGLAYFFSARENDPVPHGIVSQLVSQLSPDSVVRLSKNLAELGGLDAQWVHPFIEEASKSEFPVWCALLIAIALAKGGQQDEKISGFIEETGIRYLKTDCNQLRERFPEDTLQFALYIAYYFGKKNPTFTRAVIRSALPLVTTLEDRDALHKAVQLTDYPEEQIGDILDFSALVEQAVKVRAYVVSQLLERIEPYPSYISSASDRSPDPIRIKVDLMDLIEEESEFTQSFSVAVENAWYQRLGSLPEQPYPLITVRLDNLSQQHVDSRIDASWREIQQLMV